MMNKTKGLGILIVATFLYMGWLSPSTSGLMHQILKPVLGQAFLTQLRANSYLMEA